MVQKLPFIGPLSALLLPLPLALTDRIRKHTQPNARCGNVLMMTNSYAMNTERLSLEPMTQAEAGQLAELGADPDVVKNLICDWSTPEKRLEIARCLATLSHSKRTSTRFQWNRVVNGCTQNLSECLF